MSESIKVFIVMTVMTAGGIGYYWLAGPEHAITAFWVFAIVGVVGTIIKAFQGEPSEPRDWYNGAVAMLVYGVLDLLVFRYVFILHNWPIEVLDRLVLLLAFKAIAYWLWARLKY